MDITSLNNNSNIQLPSKEFSKESCWARLEAVAFVHSNSSGCDFKATGVQGIHTCVGRSYSSHLVFLPFDVLSLERISIMRT